MRVCLISDGEQTTELSMELINALTIHFRDTGYEVLHYPLAQDEVGNCIGCFGCWIKKPGECLINDLMSDINQTYMNSTLVIYLSPIVFGGFSASVKNVLDRTLPNISPFFTTKNGLTNHKNRYEHYPLQAIIGYGTEITTQEQNTFINWIHTQAIGDKAYLCLAGKDVQYILSDLATL